jgi:adenine-specific DNA-methyltransferase
MTQKEMFTNAGFTMAEPVEANCLLQFLKENYPNIVRDNEIKWNELKVALGLPIDEKTNGYGLNFIGRNVAKAKYAQKTAKELKINENLSKNFDTTQNMVLKGDNLDCLKILKSYYSGKIKCIYIDPPYNTQNDEFVYPDKFDAEEREVLGLANLSEDDVARMEFSFGNKRSHNGWLSFMYPRLMLARELLTNDGVIFISIDDNEQANLKLLCDEIFGEENFVGDIIWNSTKSVTNTALISVSHTYNLTYFKNMNYFVEHRDEFRLPDGGEGFENPDNDPRGAWKADPFQVGGWRPNQQYTITNPQTGVEYKPNPGCSWKNDYDKFQELLKDNRIVFGKTGESGPQRKRFIWEAMERGKVAKTLWDDIETTTNGTQLIKKMFDDLTVFSNPKPVDLIYRFLQLGSNKDSIILDFFAGSGTTGHAIMQLNAEDGGNRQFILCQIDEPIDPKKKKEAFDFCVNNNLPPVISSITVERLRRAGEKIMSESRLSRLKDKQDLFNQGNLENQENQDSDNLDVGFKVFDTVDALKLALEGEQISILNSAELTPIDRIYNMIFKVGLDNPTVQPMEIVKDCMYRCGENNYITNATELDKPENKKHLSDAVKSRGKIFIDGWTASINTTLQQYKEDIKIVF